MPSDAYYSVSITVTDKLSEDFQGGREISDIHSSFLFRPIILFDDGSADESTDGLTDGFTDESVDCAWCNIGFRLIVCLLCDIFLFMHESSSLIQTSTVSAMENGL